MITLKFSQETQKDSRKIRTQFPPTVGDLGTRLDDDLWYKETLRVIFQNRKFSFGSGKPVNKIIAVFKLEKGTFQPCKIVSLKSYLNF